MFGEKRMDGCYVDLDFDQNHERCRMVLSTLDTALTESICRTLWIGVVVNHQAYHPMVRCQGAEERRHHAQQSDGQSASHDTSGHAFRIAFGECLTWKQLM